LTVQLQLRSWQHRFARQLAAHSADDFLLVACPAAGKTIAAGAAIADVMAARECDQLIVACPTIVVRDQWAAVLGDLGFRMETSFQEQWPQHVHGVCATYMQISQRAEQYAAACARRATAVVCDEIHHVGEQRAWGDAIATAFEGARFRLMLSGTPFRSDRDRIPFLGYEAGSGLCIPDFTYDYPRAVREGVCRTIEFRAHGGTITWLDGGEEYTAEFADKIAAPAEAKRLRACLDAKQPYLAALLADAHNDLLELRHAVPDAAGLVVCDSQAHALEVDALLTEITGSLPVIAISDQPLAHQAIRAFADDDSEWLVSVRMVAEGVDIPRLGVIAWATTARTELMVRQVAGRALRGRGDHANLPAIVHMPADPTLVEYAGRLDVLGGTAPRSSHRLGPASTTTSGSTPSTASPRVFRAVDAVPTAEPARSIVPPLPAARMHSAPETIDISTPALPPSPQEIRDAALARESARGRLFALLTTYTELRRSIHPAFQVASAHSEMTAAIGPVRTDATDAQIQAALDWVARKTATLAAAHPEHVKQLARTRRRLQQAAH
jgi:superfamily II DNA or RNA helicase